MLTSKINLNLSNIKISIKKGGVENVDSGGGITRLFYDFIMHKIAFIWLRKHFLSFLYATCKPSIFFMIFSHRNFLTFFYFVVFFLIKVGWNNNKTNNKYIYYLVQQTKLIRSLCCPQAGGMKCLAWLTVVEVKPTLTEVPSQHLTVGETTPQAGQGQLRYQTEHWRK